MTAVLLGQLFVSSIAIWYYQSKNENVDYWKATKIYTHKQFPTFVAILTFTFLIMFVLSEWIDISKSRAELISTADIGYVEKIQKFFKTASAIFGIGAQWIVLVVYKKTRNAIVDYGKKGGVTIEEDKI